MIFLNPIQVGRYCLTIFFSREEYKIVTKFFLIDERIGRLAVIKNVVNCNPDELNDAINKYILNPY